MFWGYTPHLDYKHFIGNNSQKIVLERLALLDDNHLKGDTIDRSVVNGVDNEYSLVLFQIDIPVTIYVVDLNQNTTKN